MTIKIIIAGLVLSCLLGMGGFAQQTKVSLSLPTAKGKALYLTNEQRNFAVEIPSDSKSNFKASVDLPGRGFYAIDQIGEIYLEPGNALQVVATGQQSYQFKGKQSKENELLSRLKAVRATMLPQNSIIKNAPSFNLLQQPVQKFAITIQSYKDSVTKLVSASKNIFFREISVGDADSYCRVMLMNFDRFHEADSTSYIASLDFINNAKSKTDPNFKFKMYRAWLLPLMDGFLNEEDRQAVYKLYNDGFRANDHNLLQNSTWYAIISSQMALAEIPIDESKLKESYLRRLAAIPSKFPDSTVMNYLTGLQGIEYLDAAQQATTDFESAYEVLKSVSMSAQSRAMIERAFLQMKRRQL